MIQTLQGWDEQLLNLINGSGTTWMDPLMIGLSDKIIWIPLYMVLVYALYRKFGKRIWLPLLAVALTILLADQITSAFMKPYFERLRPCRDPHLFDSIRFVSKCGGKYGFASSHAANTFALATLFQLILHRRLYGLMLWAFMVSYSRIYLAAHYPGDVVVGALIGVFIAWAVYRLFQLNARFNLSV